MDCEHKECKGYDEGAPRNCRLGRLPDRCMWLPAPDPKEEAKRKASEDWLVDLIARELETTAARHYDRGHYDGEGGRHLPYTPEIDWKYRARTLINAARTEVSE